jgi:hypothetical protein
MLDAISAAQKQPIHVTDQLYRQLTAANKRIETLEKALFKIQHKTESISYTSPLICEIYHIASRVQAERKG